MEMFQPDSARATQPILLFMIHPAHANSSNLDCLDHIVSSFKANQMFTQAILVTDSLAGHGTNPGANMVQCRYLSQAQTLTAWQQQ